MKKLIGLLVILLASSVWAGPPCVPPSPLGTTTADNNTIDSRLEQWLLATSPTREYWIAPRTDGIDGDGSEHNPYDASTSAKLEALLGVVGVSWGTLCPSPSSGVIHFMPGTYHTDHGLFPLSGWTWKGNSQNKVIIEYDGNATPAYLAVISNYGLPDDSSESITISDLTVDCNAADGSSWTCGGVDIRGKAYHRIERVRATNHSAPDGSESAALRIIHLGTSGGTIGYNSIIRDCIVDNAHGAGASGISVGGGTGDPIDVAGLIENNVVIGPVSVAFALVDQKGGRIVGNYADNVTYGMLADTGNSTNLEVSNNYIHSNSWGISFGSNTYQLGGYNIHNNVFYSHSVGVLLNGNVTNSRIDHNTFDGNGTVAINVAGTGNSGIVCTDNIVPGTMTDDCSADSAVVYYRDSSGGVARKDYITIYAAEMSDNNTNPSSSPTQLFSTPNNVIVRNFDNGTSQTERFFFDPPPDMNAATLKFKWKGFVSDATSATVGQKVDFQLACTCIADEGALGTAVGTAVDNNATAAGTVVQYKQLVADGWSADVTVANWAAGLPIECRITRVVAGLSSHYNKDFGLAAVQLKIPRTIAN